jgi:hypothetical protein
MIPGNLYGKCNAWRISVHQEGDRVILRQADGPREEIDLVEPQPSRSGSAEGERETLPPSVCPDGSPTTLWQVGSGDASLPGQSPVDELDDPSASPRDPGGDL